MAYTIVCEGTITLTEVGSALCSTGWVQQIAPVPFELSQVDPSVVGMMYGAGFVTFFVPWAAAWGVSQLLNMVKVL